VGELESDNQSLKEQLDKVRAEKDALQRRFEEDGRRTMRDVQNENAALRRDLDLVRRAMEDLLNDRNGGRLDKERGGQANGGG
jgi:predicted  nucleic acid-binding Zn-ribbon protein